MDTPLEQVLERIDAMSHSQQWQVIDHVMGRLRQQSIAPVQSRSSWLELDGIAPELLGGQDAQTVVNQMRDEWDDRESVSRDANFLQEMLDNSVVVENFAPLAQDEIYRR
jgi:hypothetical protein